MKTAQLLSRKESQGVFTESTYFGPYLVLNFEFDLYSDCHQSDCFEIKPVNQKLKIYSVIGQELRRRGKATREKISPTLCNTSCDS